MFARPCSFGSHSKRPARVDLSYALSDGDVKDGGRRRRALVSTLDAKLHARARKSGIGATSRPPWLLNA
eukprot:1606186-Pleurochrysis_carterae.AAC.1